MKPILFLLFVACSDNNHDYENNLQHQIDSLSAELEKAKIELINAKNIDSLAKKENYDNEDFNIFFMRFMTDSVFQKSRIKYPLKYITWSTNSYGDVDLGGEIDTIQITEANWQYDPFYFNNASERTQIYDNFELKFRPSNERLLHWYGIETGGDAKYYFNGFEGKWFLIKKEQLGD